MRKMLGCVSIAVMILISCNNTNSKENKKMEPTENIDNLKEAQPLGKSDDIIKLSQRDIPISGSANTVRLSTEGRWWWINDIVFNENHVDFQSIDTSVNDFIIKKEDFSIERKNTTELVVKLSENISSKKRVLRITLQAGNYFDNITIEQSAK